MANETIIITGKANIEMARFAAINSALMLQAKTGLRHSTNAPVISAKKLLEADGIKPKRTIKALSAQFNDWYEKKKAAYLAAKNA